MPTRPRLSAMDLVVAFPFRRDTSIPMKIPAVLLALGAASAVQAQFTLPRVEMHRVGVACVTRPTLMAGVGMSAGAGVAGGMAVNPNTAAAFAMFAPVLQPPVAVGAPPAPVALPAVGSLTPAPKPPDPAVVAARVLAYQREQAKNGSPSAQLALALRYRTGDGVDADARLSRIWMEAAARNGSDEAARELAAGKTVAVR
jgi:hypothetical protein